MGYIMDLRKIVGHRKLLMPGAGVFPIRDGQVLLQRRQDNGLWADHGGSVELSENVEDAARRELWEETGLVAGKLHLLGVYSGPEMDYTYANGDEISCIGLYYWCEEMTGSIKIQEEEVAELKWFPLNALPDDDEISPPIRRVIHDLADRLLKRTEAEE